MQNAIAYSKQARRYTRKVWFTGTGALEKGVGVCYDRAYGTAADHDERRDKYVAVPSQANHMAFAGVTAKAYAADATGQWIEIYEPGSVCEVAASLDTTVNVTLLTCSAGEGDPGRFGLFGLMGKGSALALRTKTNVLGSSLDGTAVNVTTTITKAALFTNAAVGDKVYIVAGASAAGADIVTPGIYTIVTRTSADEAVVGSSPGATGVLSCYVLAASSPTVLAYLFDGEESGLAEWISPINNVACASFAGGGTTRIAGGYTMGAGQSTDTLAVGTRIGQRRRFLGYGTLTTQGWKVTVTNGTQKDHATALVSAVIDAAAEVVELYWTGTRWMCEWTAGATIA